MRLWGRWRRRLLIRRYGSRANRLYRLASPLKIAASASASRSSSAKPKVWIGWLRGWRYRLRCYQAEYGRADAHRVFVLPRQTRGRKAVANSVRTPSEPASKEQCNASQCYAEKHRVPGMPLPAEVRFIGDKGEDGSNRPNRDDEAILLANTACEYEGRQAPYEHPRRPVERCSGFRGEARGAPPM